MKLSVVMPVGRVDQFLRETLLSIEDQTYRDFELIMVCDTSMRSELEQFIGQVHVNFFYRILDTKLRGVAFAANLGIAAANGKYIARWDSDDLCDASRFERQIDELSKDSSLAIIGTKVEIINEEGITSRFQKFKFYENNVSIRRALKYRQPLLHSSLIFRSDVLYHNKGYLHGHTSEDHELFIRIARDNSLRFKNIPDITTYYRRHSAQLSDLSNQKIHFCEISGFMFSEFLRTANPLYILGMLVNFPPFRRIRYAYRQFLQAVLKGK
jgi:glycosyltransferase involved in cell wall biosynthesis